MLVFPALGRPRAAGAVHTQGNLASDRQTDALVATSLSLLLEFVPKFWITLAW